MRYRGCTSDVPCCVYLGFIIVPPPTRFDVFQFIGCTVRLTTSAWRCGWFCIDFGVWSVCAVWMNWCVYVCVGRNVQHVKCNHALYALCELCVVGRWRRKRSAWRWRWNERKSSWPTSSSRSSTRLSELVGRRLVNSVGASCVIQVEYPCALADYC